MPKRAPIKLPSRKQLEEQNTQLLAQVGELNRKLSMTTRCGLLDVAELNRLKRQVASTTGWFEGDLTFQLPPGRFVLVDFRDRVASIFNVPEDCPDMLTTSSGLGRIFYRLGPPVDEPACVFRDPAPLLREPDAAPATTP